MLLDGEFKNIAQSLVVLRNLPLSLIGGVFAIFFTNGILSIPAIIGFISLFGIATRNGMLLIDRYNVLSSPGHSHEDAVMTGSLARLNPILMTAITSALAPLPLALGGDLDGCDTLGGGITGVQDYPRLYAALTARGYDSALLQALFSDNWLRVLPKS